MKLTGVYIAVAATLFVRSTVSTNVTLTEDRLEAELRNEFVTWIASNGDVKLLDSRSTDLSTSSLVKRIRSAIELEPKAQAVCTLCNSVIRVIKGYIEGGMEEERLMNLIINLCMALDLYEKDVCHGIVELNMPIFLYILEQKPNLAPESVCGLVLQSNSCELTDGEFEWMIEVDDEAPQRIHSEDTEETVKIAQITDIHYDPVYEVFGNPLCSAPTCCRKGQNDTNTSRQIAGYWGDYNNCDAPWHTVENAIDQIASTESDLSYVYFTGDIIDHGIWETTREGIKESISKTLSKLRETFGNTPVYSIFGNHESNPTNVFATPDVTDKTVYTSWLYEYVADLWIEYGWLPESTRSTILQGGFYTVSPKPGFRIVAMNNNVCYTFNWWLLYQPRDPSGQLKWLAETLLQAEIDGEYVHILAHIPAGNSYCQHTWAREYRKITNRFAHIITAEFSGHTHNDEFRVIYDLENTTEAVRVAWNGGGINTFDSVNPNFKVHTVNANTYLVEDVDTWIYNLTLANETPYKAPVWYKSYSFKEEYGLKDLSLSSLNDLVIRMAHDSSILATYYGHYMKQAKPGSSCEESCRTKLLCSIVTAVANDATQCTHFSNLAQSV